MSVRNYFSHEIPPHGLLVFHYMDLQKIPYVLAGENIGWDNAPDDQATATIEDMFMDSAGLGLDRSPASRGEGASQPNPTRRRGLLGGLGYPCRQAAGR